MADNAVPVRIVDLPTLESRDIEIMDYACNAAEQILMLLLNRQSAEDIVEEFCDYLKRHALPELNFIRNGEDDGSCGGNPRLESLRTQFQALKRAKTNNAK